MSELSGFIPIDLIRTPRGWVIRWLETAGRPITAPFLGKEVKALLADGARQQLTSLATLADLPPVQPRLLIFHHSRCGSTLLSQGLAAATAWTSLSEPRAVNAALAADFDADTAVPVLRGLVSALIGGGGSNGRPAILKLSSWNLFFLDLIRAAFPDVPACFVFRDPRATLASLQRSPHGWASPDNTPEWMARIPRIKRRYQDAGPDQRTGVILAELLRAGLPSGDWQPRLIHYPDIPAATRTLANTLSGEPWTPARERALRECLSRDSHRPGRVFTSDRRDPDIAPDIDARHERFTRRDYGRLLNALSESQEASGR